MKALSRFIDFMKALLRFIDFLRALLRLFVPYLSIIFDTIVPSVSLCLRSLVLLRTTKLIEYSTLVLYSPRTGNIFSEKKEKTNKTASSKIAKEPARLELTCD